VFTSGTPSDDWVKHATWQRRSIGIAVVQKYGEMEVPTISSDAGVKCNYK
jgi:hypothetical protein